MRSRSYYAIAASSLLLLLTACPAGDAKSDGDDRKTASAKADDRVEHKADEAKDAADSGTLEGDSGEPPPEGEDTGEHEDDGEDEGDGVPLTAGTSGRKHDCEPGSMPFEGKCTPKDRIAEIVEQREDDALMRVQTAKKPDQTAEAVHDLLEQQIYQVGKAEDDLDEIIEQLRREKEEKQLAEMPGGRDGKDRG